MIQSKQLFILFKLQFHQIKNISLRKLKEYPIISSLFLLLVMLYYFLYETYIFSQIQGFTLNHDISHLFNSITLVYFMFLIQLGVIGASIFVISNMLAKQTSRKLRLFPVTKYTIDLSSIFLVSIILNILLLPFLVLVLMNISPNLLVFIIMFVFGEILINLTFLFCAALTFSLSITIRNLIKFLNNWEEIVNVTSAYLVIILLELIVKPMTVSNALDISLITIILTTTIGSFLLHLYNKKISKKNLYVEKNQKNYEKIEINTKNVTFDNYILLLLRNKNTYRDLFYTFIALSAVLIFTDQQATNHEFTRNVLLIFSVISSGIIYRFHLWFRLNSNSSLIRLLIYDALLVFFVSTFLYSIFLLSVYKNMTIDLLLIYVLALTMVLLIQNFLKLKFNAVGESSVSFIFFYSFLSFISLVIIEQLSKLIGYIV